MHQRRRRREPVYPPTRERGDTRMSGTTRAGAATTDQTPWCHRDALEMGVVRDDAVGSDNGGRIGSGVNHRCVLDAGLFADLDATRSPHTTPRQNHTADCEPNVTSPMTTASGRTKAAEHICGIACPSGPPAC